MIIFDPRSKIILQWIIEIYQDIAKTYKGTTNPLDVHLVLDKERHHYQLLMLGWRGDNYIFQSLLHIDIRKGKIWIQWNTTEYPFEEELVKKRYSPF